MSWSSRGLVNLKLARSVGWRVPRSVLLQSTRVID